MKVFSIILSVILFSGIIGATQVFAQECDSGHKLIFKSSNGNPACVTPTTAQKLVERGWSMMQTEPFVNYTDSCKAEPDPGLCRAAFVKYYFNSETLSCEQFIWGGCGGVVPFDLLETCQMQCEDKEVLTPISVVDATGVVDANNQFAIDFYSQAAKENDDENIFFSPWSISTVAAIVYEGAKGNTADEMQKVFGFPANSQERRLGFESVINDLNEPDKKYELQVANALWVTKEFEPLSEYVNIAKNYYDSEISSVDFTTDEGVNTINDWVNEKTKEKIEKILEPGATDASWRLAVTNAIYFKGTWENQFAKDQTRDGEFHVDSQTTVTVPMMRLGSTLLNYTETEQLEILEMPYEGNKTSMLIILPKDIDGINLLDESLSVENLSRWQDSLSEKHMVVFMPKFTLETKYDLIKHLPNMGMKDAFDPNKADFSGIIQLEPLVIKAAIHKAFVDVNEEGTEAAAVTGFGVVATSAPPTLFANHPFVFLIQDNETRNILFIGKMMNPS